MSKCGNYGCKNEPLAPEEEKRVFFSSTGHVYLNKWLRPLSIYSGYQAQVCRMGSIFAEFDLDPDIMKLLLMLTS